MTSIQTPANAALQRHLGQFKAFGVDGTEVRDPQTLVLKFDQKSGFEHAVATAAMRGSVDGAKLVFELAEGASVPKMLPTPTTVVPTLSKLYGIEGVSVGETSPEQIFVNASTRESASALSALLVEKLPNGSPITVRLQAAPNV